MFGIELHHGFFGRRVKSLFAASRLVESDDDDRIFDASPAPDVSAILGANPYCFDIESKKSRHTFWGSPFASESSDLAELESIAGQAAAQTAIGF
jgi:hypothetical protein